MFELELTDGGWASEIHVRLDNSEALLERPEGSAAPSVAVSWEVTAQPVSPVWDLYGGSAEKEVFAGDTHIQQAFATSGQLTVGDRSYRLDGWASGPLERHPDVGRLWKPQLPARGDARLDDARDHASRPQR